MEKVLNYTTEQTAQVLKLYAEKHSLESISELVGKSKHSVVAKLVREGVYETTTPTTKRMKKKDMIAQIEVDLELPLGSLETVEKASHEAIQLLMNAVAG